jgi:hypothetical protein
MEPDMCPKCGEPLNAVCYIVNEIWVFDAASGKYVEKDEFADVMCNSWGRMWTSCSQRAPPTMRRE